MYAAAYATIQCTAWAGEWQNRQAGLCGQVLCWPLPPACCCPYPGQAPADLECWARKASWRPAEPVATLQPNPPTSTSTSPTPTPKEVAATVLLLRILLVPLILTTSLHHCRPIPPSFQMKSFNYRNIAFAEIFFAL